MSKEERYTDKEMLQKKKVVSNMLGHRNPPPQKSKDLLKFEWERKQWKEQTQSFRTRLWRWW